MKARFFRTAAEFRTWLQRHHATAGELVVGFYKRAAGKPGLTWPESVDEALCCGWIDGIRKRVDEERYTIRFTPRRAATWWVLSARLEATRLRRAVGQGAAHSAVHPQGSPEKNVLASPSRAGIIESIVMV